MKKEIIVLGIHDGHNASAALVKNGSVVAAIQEERLVNEKNYSGTPRNSISAYLEQVQKRLRKVLAEQRFDNIAAACQIYFEELVIQWARNCITETFIRKIACAGGSLLNVKANKVIREYGNIAKKIRRESYV